MSLKKLGFAILSFARTNRYDDEMIVSYIFVTLPLAVQVTPDIEQQLPELADRPMATHAPFTAIISQNPRSQENQCKHRFGHFSVVESWELMLISVKEGGNQKDSLLIGMNAVSRGLCMFR